ncbi:MAG: response regulator [Cellvibrio sp.]|uniref:response regulator n=1 Tax=Cellvibrio sp. TaxID=1965322 RepID=UPI0031B217E9
MPLRIFKDALVLNVDDSDGARYAKSRILTHAGLRVIEASNGEDAIARAHAEMPDLILLDVKLPDINGMEVCRRLKENPSTKAILILQTSASFIDPSDKVRALDGGADNYLVEPIEPDELIANVKALLRLGRVERELRDMDRRKDEFLATLAHELRNPLGPIRTSVELLRRLDPTALAAQEHARNTIQRHTDHLVRLVDDLLDVARISQGKISLRHEAVNLRTAIDNAVETSTQAINNKGHSLEVVFPSEPIQVCGDQVRLSQIVANLLLNAAKFTEPGGRIGLYVDLQKQGARIRITDNGIGIEAGAINAIFNLFSQHGHLSDQVQDGLGIGLSLVKNLVSLHGGTVTAISDGLGKGSTFEIVLPVLSQTQIDAKCKMAEQPEVSSEVKKVLIVDDNVDAADTLAQLLGMTGHSVKVAYTGQQAIDIAAQFPADIIFLDIGLPDMSGYEVAAQLRALPNGKQFTLIALTGYGQEQDRSNAFASGFDDHFAKPVDFDKLRKLGLHL